MAKSSKGRGDQSVDGEQGKRAETEKIIQNVVNHARTDMPDVAVAAYRSDRVDAPEPAERESSGPSPPSTSSVLWAAWRQGLKDLQDRVLNPWHGQSNQRDEPGSIANPTQQDVNQNQHPERINQEYDPADYARPGNTPEKSRGRSR
ncbi:hypothetical protein [Paludisphaera sp.]|uniref:hypothetical protein n=1 Tax=Paludisphaera sp. TaxID=2017432 RepID=UPI00301DACA8